MRFITSLSHLLKNLKNHFETFNEYLNTKHANIKFTGEKEVNGSLPFLDVLISQNKKDFTTAVYHKPIFSGVYSNFNSFMADNYKHGLIFTLLFRIFLIALDFSKFHEEDNHVKDVLKKNSFSTNSMDKRIKIFLNKKFSQKILEHAVPKKELFSVLAYLGMSSLCLRTRLQGSINNNISFCKIKIIFKSSTRLANFFRFRDKIALCLHSNLSSFYINLLQVLVANFSNISYFIFNIFHFNIIFNVFNNIISYYIV